MIKKAKVTNIDVNNTEKKEEKTVNICESVDIIILLNSYLNLTQKKTASLSES